MFHLEMDVRDSELDAQGIVNNSNYFRYMEHARHKYLQTIGPSFAALAQQNQLLVLLETQIQFKQSLRSNDLFYVTCTLEPESRVRFACVQHIYRLPDRQLMCSARNIITCLDGNKKNRPYLPTFIEKQLPN
jgi:acyl-CoA thioester hydrolase